MGIKREELKALVERNGDSAAKEFSLANWKQDVEDALYSVSKKSNGFEWTLGNNTDPIRDIATPDAFLISTSFESQLVENLTASKFIKKKRITHSSALPIRRKPFGARATETNPRSKRLHTAGDTIPTAQERVEALANVGQKNIQKRLKTADHMVSNEMKVSSKENLIETIGTGIWDDKMLSQLSRPLTSEQFCGSGSFTVEQQHLNAPKYMEPITHTGELEAAPPSFPYSREAHFGAVKMQSVWRYRKFRVDRSVLLIQRIARGYLKRRHFIWRRERFNDAATLIQTRARGLLARRLVKWMRFVPHLQRIYRGHLGRKRAAWIRTVLRLAHEAAEYFINKTICTGVAHIRTIQNKYACIIQARMRGYLGRARAARLKFWKETKAVLTIQTRFRGNMARFRFRFKRKTRAATVVQKYARRHLATLFYPQRVQNAIEKENLRLEGERSEVLEARNASRQEMRMWLFKSKEGRRYHRRCKAVMRKLRKGPLTKRMIMLQIIDSRIRSDDYIHKNEFHKLLKDLMCVDVFHTPGYPSLVSDGPVHKREFLSWFDGDRRRKENRCAILPCSAFWRAILRALKYPLFLSRRRLRSLFGIGFRHVLLQSILLDSERHTHYSAMAEYRILHRPPFECKHCYQTFVLYREYVTHETNKHCRVNDWTDEERHLSIAPKISILRVKAQLAKKKIVSGVRSMQSLFQKKLFPEPFPPSQTLVENLAGISSGNTDGVVGAILAAEEDMDEFVHHCQLSIAALVYRMKKLLRGMKTRKAECQCILSLREAVWSLGCDTVIHRKDFKSLLDMLDMDFFSDAQYLLLTQLLFPDVQTTISIEVIGKWFLNEKVYKSSIVPHDDVPFSMKALKRKVWKKKYRADKDMDGTKRIALCVLHEWIAAFQFSQQKRTASKGAGVRVLKPANFPPRPHRSKMHRLKTIAYMSKMLRQRASKVRLAEALVLQQSTKTDEELAKEYPAWIGLHRLGFSFDTCIMALRENDGDMKRASNWLLSIEEDEISQIEKVWGKKRKGARASTYRIRRKIIDYEEQDEECDDGSAADASETEKGTNTKVPNVTPPAAEDSRTEDHLSKNSPAEDIIAQDGDTPIEKDATHSKAPAMSKLGCCFKTKTAKALNINKIAKALDTNENPANKDQPQEPIDAETSLQNENTDAIENEEGEDFLAQDVFSEEEPGAEEERAHNGEQGEEQEQMEHLSESLEDDDNVAVSDEENACNKGTSLVRDKLSFESADEDEILSFFYTPISTMVSPLLRRKLASIITDKL